MSRHRPGPRSAGAGTRRGGDASMVAAGGGDPLAGVERVLIDGSNLLHALARGTHRPPGSADGAGAGGPMPSVAVVGRLRAAFPANVIVDLVFDGPPAGGITGRLATGLRVAYSGRRSADAVIDDGVAAQLAADGPAATWGLLVVTDDRGLRDAVAAKGARTAGTAWLAGRIGRLPPAGPPQRGRARGVPAPGRPPLPKAGTTIGHRRPPLAPTTERD